MVVWFQTASHSEERQKMEDVEKLVEKLQTLSLNLENNRSAVSTLFNQAKQLKDQISANPLQQDFAERRLVPQDPT
ncbi:hypothetical protein HK096_001380, partial [Nowakowskiella sp. JEL0078]